MSLLNELKKLKPRFPETEFHVPEWDRAVTLRGFSLREARELKPANGEADDERSMLRALAHAIVSGDDRPLANEDGIALLETLSPKTIHDMVQAFMRLSGLGQDMEGNFGARADTAGSSTASPSPSAGQLPN